MTMTTTTEVNFGADDDNDTAGRESEKQSEDCRQASGKTAARSREPLAFVDCG